MEYINKITILIILLLAICLNMSAQQAQGNAIAPILGRRDVTSMQTIDVGLIRCTYAFNADTIGKTSTYLDLQCLEIGKHISKYYSRFVFDNDSIIWMWRQKHPKAQSVKRQMAPLGKRNYYWSEYKYSEIFKYHTRNKLCVYSRMPHGMMKHDNRFYTDSLTLQKWQLQSGTLRINGYLCHKATCMFRGRSYVAWYAKDIPVSDGPWKFGGLPGLILKIYDTQKLYTFECIKIEYLNFPIKQYAGYSEYAEYPRKEMLKLEKDINEDYFKIAKVKNSKTGKYISNFTPYNPLELY